MAAIPREGSSIENPFNKEIPKIEFDLKRKTTAQEKSLLSEIELPFANPTERAQEEPLVAKQTPLDDALVEELGTVLNSEATKIEKEIEELEKNKKNQELFTAIIENEQFGGWVVEKMDSANESVKMGIEFLENVIPHQILSELPSQIPFEQVSQITLLGGAFLTALDSGLLGLALICKAKIIRQSEEILARMKSESGNRPSNEKAIVEWEINLQREKESLAEEKLKFEVDTAYNIFYFISLPLTYFPSQAFAKCTKIANACATWIMSGLEVVSYALDLKKVSKESDIFNKWKDAYLKWQEEHLIKSPVPLQTPAPPILTDQQLVDELSAFIQKEDDFVQIRIRLKDFNIDLDPSLKTKKEFLHYLSADSTFHQIALSYIQHRRQLEALDELIRSSKNLLEKRQAIRNKKTYLLKPQFQQTEGKIQKMKEGHFIRDMQEVLWVQLNDPNCSPLEVKDILQKWGFYRPAISPQAAEILQAFDHFENEASGKEELIRAFTQWMMHPAAMNEQFQLWYRQEAAENLEGLLAFYVDHQETIEQTTKNALKQMVEKKHAIESRFIDLKLKSSWIYLCVAAISLIVGGTLAILALLSMPFGGAAVILLALSIGSIVINFGLFGASYLQGRIEKPNLTRLMSLKFQTKMMWIRLRASISAYSHQSKEKKLFEVAKILHKLHTSLQTKVQPGPDYQKALKAYKQAKLEFEESQKKVNDWTARLKRLESTINEKSWQDFAMQASLQVNENPEAFDALRCFQEAFKACDLNLLSKETKTLLTIQLGVDLKALQAQINKDPDAVRKVLQDFFILDDANLVAFIRNQEERMHRGLLRENSRQFA